MRKAHSESVVKYVEIINQKDNELKTSNETIRDLYKDNAERLGESLVDVTTALRDVHNSNAMVVSALQRVEGGH